MARKKKQKNAADEGVDLWDVDNQTTLEERKNLSNSQSREKKTRRWRRAVVSVLVLSPVLLGLGGYGLLNASAANREAAKAIASQSGNTLDAPGKAQAWAEVESWLSETPSPLPDGKIISWDGAEKISWPILDTNTGQIVEESQATNLTDSTTYTRYVHSFTVQVDEKTDSNGNVVTPTKWYNVQVLIAYSATKGSAVMGSPTITPEANSENNSWAADEQTWPNGVSGVVPRAVSDSVGAWVSAFTSGDSTKLRVYVSDPNSSNSYAPLTGIVSSKWTINYAAYKVSDSDLKNKVTSSTP